MKNNDLCFPGYYFFVLLFFFTSCISSEPFYATQELEQHSSDPFYQNTDTLHTFFLIGDTGDPELDSPDPVLSTLRHHLSESPDRSSVIFLGDNIYSSGMPPNPQHEERELSEEKISVALSALKGISRPSYFIPGNHDWRYGQQGLMAQEEFIENRRDINASMVPSYGCPGPFYATIADDWILIALDSEWLVKQGQLAETVSDRCLFRTHDEVMDEVERIVNNYPDKQFLIATHHPLYSNGSHGGYYTLKDHIFPLTNLESWYYLPMPVLGSVYPIYRKIGNSSQDIPNPAYQKYKTDLLKATQNAQTRIFASGHEHSLAFFDLGDHSSVVSGSGSKKSFARKGEGADFVYSENGFAKLIAFNNGDHAIEFWTPAEGHSGGTRVFSKLKPLQKYTITEDTDPPSSQNQNIGEPRAIAPGPGYQAGGLKKMIWGDHYRDVWTTPIEATGVNLAPLRILSIGGGQQSVSIVVEDTTGKRSILRSIQKDPAEALPEILRETFARDIIQDQISASHPYGALIVSSLAENAGIYQTAPQIKYISHESGLPLPGSESASLVLFEEFVSVPWFESQTGKITADILSTTQVWNKARKDNRYSVDQKQFLRSRIFDMFIGDWDRHDGQWFWAEIETDNGSFFESIPIDRDNAFFKSDGLIPRIASRKWALRKFQHFERDIRDIKGINFNARHLDRWFLTELDREQWLRIAQELEDSLTDENIDSAVHELPASAFEISGEEIAEKLKARRLKLREFAERYYEVLARDVNVFGSNQSDHFRIERLENGNVHVALYNTGNSDTASDRVHFERTFITGETDEIHLYGFDGDDIFEISGTNNKNILIRLIPGRGTDTVNDFVKNASGKTNVKIYDSYNGLSSNTGRGTEIIYSDDQNVHRFDHEAFQYNYAGPLLSGGYNPDDGIFLGGGIRFIRHGFRKSPYQSLHEFSVKHSVLTSAFSFQLENSFTELIGSMDFDIDLTILAPNYKANYFGLGNETSQLSDSRSFYRFRMDQIRLNTTLQKRISSITRFRFGSGYAFFKPSETPGRFVSSEPANLNPDDFQGHHFALFSSSFQINSTDNTVIPNYGFRFRTNASLNLGLDNQSLTFLKLGTEGTLYYTVEEANTTVGLRIGAETNVGDFNFFRANTLGGHSLLGDQGKLRGFLRDRFAGKTAFYHNLDLRTRLFNFQSYFFPASVGVIGFFDNGRVWVEGQNSDKWHQGYGGGIWITPFRRVVLTATYSLSDEDQIFSINTGFSF